MTIQVAVEPVSRNEAGLASALPILAAALRRAFHALRRGPPPARPTHDLARQPAARRRIFAESTDDVAEIVRVCADHRVPVIPFGVGTSLEGHVNAPARRRLDRPRAHEPRARRPRRRISTASSSRASPASSSTSTCATWASSSRSTPAPSAPSAAWPRRAPRAPTRCATAPCATTSSTSPPSCPTATVIKHRRSARQEIVRRLRPDPAPRRLRGHARRHHRADPEALRHPGGDCRRRLPVPERRGAPATR